MRTEKDMGQRKKTTANKKTRRGRPPKNKASIRDSGFMKERILDVAIETIEENEGFTVREVARRLGCDPMTIIYHFGSKDGLERAMADVINAKVIPVDPNAAWRDRLKDLAFQYRSLALRYPNTFPLLMKFWVTGPADYHHAEMVYQALTDAGLKDAQVVDVCFGWYASMLGMAMAEVKGLLKPVSEDVLDEIGQLSANEFPVMSRLLPSFQKQKEGSSYKTMVETVLNGIERFRF